MNVKNRTEGVAGKPVEMDVFSEAMELELVALSETFDAELKTLLSTVQSVDRDLEVIDCVQNYGLARERLIAGERLAVDMKKVRATVRELLLERLSYFLTDSHRHEIVAYHAQGLSTSESVFEVVSRCVVLHALGAADAIGWDVLRPKLIHYFAYLKPGTTGWSEKKYGATYDAARAAYKKEVSDLPLSSTPEQVALLVKHVSRLDKMIENQLERGSCHPQSLGALTQTLLKTVECLRKLTADVPQRQIDPKLIFKENILVLPPADQLSLPDVKAALVRHLEQYLQTLKASDSQKALVEVSTVANEDANGGK